VTHLTVTRLPHHTLKRAGISRNYHLLHRADAATLDTMEYMEYQNKQQSNADIMIDFAGELDVLMSQYLSDTLGIAAKNGTTSVTISLSHIRKTRWNAACMFMKIVRAWQEKGLHIRVTDAKPHVAMLLQCA
jgi:anti-anti-sigma regulatory factor